MNPVILLIIAILVGPLAVLIPAILEDFITSGKSGDSNWLVIGPIVYGSGLIPTFIITAITYVFLLLLGADNVPFITGQSVLIMESVAFVVFTAVLIIQNIRGESVLPTSK